MTTPLFASIVATGFLVALLHGALPTHWLPFVLVGRRQAWPAARTLTVTAAAGLGHVAMTMALGALLVASGIAASERLGRFAPWVAGGLLFALGLFYLARHSVAAGRGHHHLPLFRRFGLPDTPDGDGAPRLSDRTAILGLMTVLTLSPCEAFLPVYLSGARFGWEAFGLLTVTLAAASVFSMTMLTGLTLAGVRWAGRDIAERSEGFILGAALCLLGVLVVVLER